MKLNAHNCRGIINMHNLYPVTMKECDELSFALEMAIFQQGRVVGRL